MNSITVFVSRQRSHAAVFVFAVALALTGLQSCGSGVNLFDKSQDVQLGQQVAGQIAADPAHYPVLNNPTLTNYIQGIENRIVSSPNVTNKDFQYQVTIINDPKTVNAFSIPGGHMYVYTGLLKYIDDEATLAGVLAHETTHADKRHSTQQMTQQYGIQAITALALGNNPGLLAQVAASLATNLTVMKFSRNDELEADKNSFLDLNQLPGRPWFPGAVKEFLSKTLHDPQPSKLQALFQTHPPSQERIDQINTLLQQAGLPMDGNGANLNANGYAQYKAMVP